MLQLSCYSSTVIDQIRGTHSSSTALAFIYFDYLNRDRQTLDHVISSLLRQLLSAAPDNYKYVLNIYEKHSQTRTTLIGLELERLFFEVLGELQTVYLAVDALDECGCLTTFIGFLQRARALKNCHLFVTSRPHLSEINAACQGFSHIKIEAHEEDLRKYMQQEIRQNSAIAVEDSSLITKIVDTILGNAHGM